MTHEYRKLRWGVLGYARIAREHVMPAIQRSTNSELHAVASRDETKLADCRTRFNVGKTVAAYDELLRDPEIEAVYIPLPNSLHREWVIKAVEQGKHVLCEKPIALNAADCREMIAASVANGVTLMEAFMYRYTLRVEGIIDVLRAGDLGEIKFINSSFHFLLTNPTSIKLQPELGGGSLYDVGCYPVNFVGFVMDEIARAESGAVPGSSGLPESVTAECVRSGGVDTMFSALLKYPSGLIASVHCGFNAQRRVSSEIIGTQGTLAIPDTFLDNSGTLTLIIGDEHREISVPHSDRYRLEVEDFAEAVLHRRPTHFTLAETQRNMEVMDLLVAAGAD